MQTKNTFAKFSGNMACGHQYGTIDIQSQGGVDAEYTAYNETTGKININGKGLGDTIYNKMSDPATGADDVTDVAGTDSK